MLYRLKYTNKTVTVSTLYFHFAGVSNYQPELHSGNFKMQDYVMLLHLLTCIFKFPEYIFTKALIVAKNDGHASHFNNVLVVDASL